MRRWRTMARRVLVAAACVLSIDAAQAQQSIVASSDRPRIDITTDFTGYDLTIFGATDGPGDIVVVLRGPNENVAVRRKRRILGIWVAADKVSFADVPSFYAVASSLPLEELAPDLRRRLEVGIDQLPLALAKMERETDTDAFRQALTRTKQEIGLYPSTVAKVNVLGTRLRLFQAKVHLPANLPTGKYTVVAYLLPRDGGEIGHSVYLEVSEAGVSADVSFWARNYSLAYGMLAVVGALLAGWIAHLALRKL